VEQSRGSGGAVTPAQVEELAPVGVVVKDPSPIAIGWRGNALKIPRATDRRVEKRPVLQVTGEPRKKVRHTRRAVGKVRHVARERRRHHPERRVAGPVFTLEQTTTRANRELLRADVVLRRREPQQREADARAAADDVGRVAPLDASARASRAGRHDA